MIVKSILKGEKWKKWEVSRSNQRDDETVGDHGNSYSSRIRTRKEPGIETSF